MIPFWSAVMQIKGVFRDVECHLEKAEDVLQ